MPVSLDHSVPNVALLLTRQVHPYLRFGGRAVGFRSNAKRSSYPNLCVSLQTNEPDLRVEAELMTIGLLDQKRRARSSEQALVEQIDGWLRGSDLNQRPPGYEKLNQKTTSRLSGVAY